MEIEFLGTHIIGGDECKIYKYQGEYMVDKIVVSAPITLTEEILEKIGLDVNQPYSVVGGVYEQVKSNVKT